VDPYSEKPINPHPNGITIHHLTSLYLIPSSLGCEIITEQLEDMGSSFQQRIFNAHHKRSLFNLLAT
jgi:hypothetical protein